MLGHNYGRIAGEGLPPLRGQLGEPRGEVLHLEELRLRAALGVGQPEVDLEGVVAVRVLLAQIVVVAVVPGDPAP